MSFISGRRIKFPSANQAVLESFEVPGKRGPDEVLVEAKTTLVSAGTERALLRGDRDPFPITPGYSFVGNVLAVGEEVGNVRPGQRVFIQAPHASHVVVKASTPLMSQIPEAVPSLDATFTRLAVVALYGVRRAKIAFGESLIVLGGGVVGQLVLRLATMTGALPKVLADVKSGRLRAALNQGADMLIDMSPASVEKALAATYENKGFDIVIDTTGHTPAFLEALELIRTGGRIVMLGTPHETITIHNLGRKLNLKNANIIGSLQPNNPVEGSLEWPWGQKRERELVLELMAQRKLDVQSIPVMHISPEEAPAFYQGLENPSEETLSCVIDW